MTNFFERLKRDKLLFILVIIAAVTLVYNFSILIFDVAQIIQTQANTVMVSSKFVTLNVRMIVFAAYDLFVLIFGVKRLRN